ncbi:MAG: hypothetical protein HC796_00715 [Synechococcaceae cyanobacterium RL_1_2]|nr:hypothetical protein [Synechococcaceae cyanobacterium RL_1_2]
MGLNAGTLTAQIISVNGATLGTPVDVTAGGSTEALLAAAFPNGTGGIGEPGEVESEDTFTVRITATVTETVATNPVSVQYGDTPPNDNSAATQNQSASNGLADVNTLDVADGLSGEPAGAPVNGEREAAAFLRTNLSTQVRNVALLTVEKTRLTQTINNPASATDDQLLYRLDATVESTSANGGFQPAALEGTNISVDGTPGTYVLISDAVPVGTVIDSAFDINANLPAGWVAVYTTDPTTTPAPTATWTSAAAVAPFIPNTATRVGFVYDTVANGVIPLGGSTQTATPDLLNDPGLFFRVITSGLPASGDSVNNIAQGFGETQNDPTNEIIYDESGDQKPNNFNDDNTPPDPTGSNFNPAIDDGVADPATDGTDPGNDNTGTGPKGEDNVVVVTPVAPPSLGLFNGPDQAPQAIGPTTDQDDFTNQSTPENGGDPAPELFNNTVNNPPTNSSQIDNVTLRPIRPSFASGATPGAEDYGVDTDIPDGTVVTITNDAGTVSAVYDYTAAGGFVLNPGLSTGLGGTLNNFEDFAVNIGTLPLGGSTDYTVTVDLPPGTPELTRVSIPIVAILKTPKILDLTPLLIRYLTSPSIAFTPAL